MLTRREAIAAGSALLLAGCGHRAARLLAGNAADVPALGTALEVERTQIALYEAALRVLTGARADVARTALAQERAHAAALEESIRELGARPAPPRARSAYETGFPPGASAGAWIQFAIQFEERAAAGYAAAIPKLQNRRLRATFGAIMTSEGEHAVALDVAR